MQALNEEHARKLPLSLYNQLIREGKLISTNGVPKIGATQPRKELIVPQHITQQKHVEMVQARIALCEKCEFFNQDANVSAGKLNGSESCDHIKAGLPCCGGRVLDSKQGYLKTLNTQQIGTWFYDKCKWQGLP